MVLTIFEPPEEVTKETPGEIGSGEASGGGGGGEERPREAADTEAGLEEQSDHGLNKVEARPPSGSEK